MNQWAEATLAQLGRMARQRGISADALVATCVGEFFLQRLAASPYVSEFVVKGGHLFGFWEGIGRRPTRDVDLGCAGEFSEEELENVLREIASIPLDDGATFDADAVRIELAFMGLPRGLRVCIPAHLGTAAARLKIDVTFGQPVTPGPELRWHHGLIDHRPALLSCAPQETMMAEKLAVAVEFGADNTRLRDYHDLWYLARTRRFGGEISQLAVQHTFAARSAATFLALDDGYWKKGFLQSFATAGRRRAWRGLASELLPGQDSPDFERVLDDVGAFAVPLLTSVRDRRAIGAWTPGVGWRTARSRGAARRQQLQP